MPAGRRATLGTAALGVLAAAAAWGVAAALTAEPKLALAAPLFVVAATVCLRWPAEGLIGVLALTGFSGSLSAFTDISAAPVADLILLGLWAAVIWGHLAGGGRGTAWLWPGVVACGLYLGLTMIEILAAPDPELALSSFRIGAWYMLAMLLVAYAPWPPRTYLRIARGAVLVALAVGELCGAAKADRLRCGRAGERDRDPLPGAPRRSCASSGRSSPLRPWPPGRPVWGPSASR